MKKQHSVPIPPAAQQVLKAARPAKDDPEGSTPACPPSPARCPSRTRTIFEAHKKKADAKRIGLFACFWACAYFSTAAAKSRPY